MCSVKCMVVSCSLPLPFQSCAPDIVHVIVLMILAQDVNVMVITYQFHSTIHGTMRITPCELVFGQPPMLFSLDYTVVNLK